MYITIYKHDYYSYHHPGVDVLDAMPRTLAVKRHVRVPLLFRYYSYHHPGVDLLDAMPRTLAVKRHVRVPLHTLPVPTVVGVHLEEQGGGTGSRWQCALIVELLAPFPEHDFCSRTARERASERERERERERES